MKILKVITLLILFAGLSFAQIESKVFLDKAFITDIKQDGNYLFVATYGQGIYQYSLKEGVWKNFSTKTGDVDNDLFHCVSSSQGFIWAGSNEGLYIYNRNTKKWTVRKFSEGGEFGNWIRALHFDKKRNLLWIGRFRNVTLYDVKANSFREFNRVIDGNEKTNNINCISADGDSVLWFGAEFGVHKLKLDSKNQFNGWSYFNNKGRAFLGEGEMVSVSDVLSLKNSIWFGTEEFITKENPQYNLGGIYVNDRRFNWKRISKSDGLAGNGIFSLARIGNYIIAGVYEFSPTKKAEFGKGLALININTNKATSIDLNQFEIKSAEIRTIHFDGTDLWLGTGAGLIRVKVANSLAKWGVK
jgi:ligand-binding sensor domain-containing protein